MTAATAPERLLIVDDEPAVREVLSRGLWEAGYQCASAGSAQEALPLLTPGSFALVLTDVRMPGMDGFALLEQAQRRDEDLFVIMVTALAGLDTALRAVRAGAYDFITKPFKLAEIDIAIKRALAHRKLQIENRAYTTRLEQMVAERTRVEVGSAIDIVTSLGLALEARDAWTHHYSQRVAALASGLGNQLGLAAEQRDELRLAGLLHDIGNIGVSESVLHKRGGLTPEEYAQVQLHPVLGARMLAPLAQLKPILPTIQHHHERWDGSGYPDHLTGAAIPLGARIISVADAYVAMMEDRPYRAGMSQASILLQLRADAQRQFDPEVVQALLDLWRSTGLKLVEMAVPVSRAGIRTDASLEGLLTRA